MRGWRGGEGGKEQGGDCDRWWMGLMTSQSIDERISESKLPGANTRGGYRALRIGLTRFISLSRNIQERFTSHCYGLPKTQHQCHQGKCHQDQKTDSGEERRA